MVIARQFFSAVALVLLSGAAVADYRAVQIDADNVDSLPRGGLDAIAGIGDWWLSNGVICAAISDVEHDAGIVAGGGSLIDLGFCGRRDDQWTYANVLTGMAKDEAIPPRVISAQQARDQAVVRVVGEAGGLRQTLSFELSEEHPEELNLWVEVERIAEGRAVHLSGLLTLYPHRAMTPFSFSSFAPEDSLGFSHPAIDRGNMLSLARGMKRADWNVLVGSHLQEPSISYGVQLASAQLIDSEGDTHALPRFLLTLPDYSLHGWLTRPLWFGEGELGLWQLAQSQFMDLDVGERLRVRFRLVPGASADVAAVTDRLYHGPELRGILRTAPAVLELRTAEGRPLTQRRIEQTGPFSLRLPAALEAVQVIARAPWGEELSQTLAVKGDTDLGDLVFQRRGVVHLPRGQIMKLIFNGVGGTPNPRLRDDLLDFREAGELVDNSAISNTVSLAGVPSDPETLLLAPGRYRVLATRGLEYSVTDTMLEVAPGKPVSLTINAPQRELQPDWVSADLHVHAGASFDSSLPIAERLRSFVAQGTQVLVLSEHNRIVDPSETLAAMGLQGKLRVVPGAELTSMARTAVAPTTLGHSNVFPLMERERQFAGGVPRVEGRRLRSLIAETRYRYPRALFQLNHPRSPSPMDSDEAFFDHLSFGKSLEPSLPLSHPRNVSLVEADPSTGYRDIDVDAIEVMNGPDRAGYRRTRRDWLSLLNQGLRPTATGNSDSHGLGAVVGVPRNYVACHGVDSSSGGSNVDRHDGTDCPIEALMEALRHGQSYITSGPLLTLTLGGQEPGSELRGAEHTLEIHARAASWVDVDTLRLYLNGRLWRETELRKGVPHSEKVHVGRDSVLVVEVFGSPGALYNDVLPGFTPVALANPFYIDADGDGRWQPPGVP